MGGGIPGEGLSSNQSGKAESPKGKNWQEFSENLLLSTRLAMKADLVRDSAASIEDLYLQGLVLDLANEAKAASQAIINLNSANYLNQVLKNSRFSE